MCKSKSCKKSSCSHQMLNRLSSFGARAISFTFITNSTNWARELHWQFPQSVTWRVVLFFRSTTARYMPHYQLRGTDKRKIINRKPWWVTVKNNALESKTQSQLFRFGKHLKAFLSRFTFHDGFPDLRSEKSCMALFSVYVFFHSIKALFGGTCDTLPAHIRSA